METNRGCTVCTLYTQVKQIGSNMYGQRLTSHDLFTIFIWLALEVEQRVATGDATCTSRCQLTSGLRPLFITIMLASRFIN